MYHFLIMDICWFCPCVNFYNHMPLLHSVRWATCQSSRYTRKCVKTLNAIYRDGIPKGSNQGEDNESEGKYTKHHFASFFTIECNWGEVAQLLLKYTAHITVPPAVLRQRVTPETFSVHKYSTTDYFTYLR